MTGRCGTRTAYVAGCRCPPCTASNTTYMQGWKQRQPLLDPDDPRHGTNNGYVNYNCRCGKCTEAHTTNAGQRRKVKQAA